MPGDDSMFVARPLLIHSDDQGTVNGDWAREFCRATRRIPPGHILPRLSLSLDTLRLTNNVDDNNTDDTTQAAVEVLEWLTRALDGRGIAFLEARLVVDNVEHRHHHVLAPHVTALAHGVARHTRRVLRLVVDNGADASLLRGALAGLRRRRDDDDDDDEGLQLFCEWRTTPLHDDDDVVMRELMDTCRTSRRRLRLLCLDTPTVTREFWNLITGLLESSSLRCLQVTAREMTPPDPSNAYCRRLHSALASNTTLKKLILFFPLSPSVTRALCRGLEDNTTLRSLKTLCPGDRHGHVTLRLVADSVPRWRGVRHFCMVAPRQRPCPTLTASLYDGLRRNTSLWRWTAPLPSSDDDDDDDDASSSLFPLRVTRWMERNRLLHRVTTSSSSELSRSVLGSCLHHLTANRHAEIFISPLYHVVTRHVIHVLAERGDER